MEKLQRIVDLDRLIRLGRMESAEQAARKLGTSNRTVERDLTTLKRLGANVRFNRTRQLYQYVGKPVTLPAQWLSEQEIAVILIAERALRVFTNTALPAQIHPAFNKLLDPIRRDRDMIDYIHDLCRSVHFYRPIMPVRDLRDEFSAVLKAIMDRRRISVYYTSSGKPVKDRRGIDPYALVNNGGDWYVIGECHWKHEVRTFALAQMHDPKPTEHYFLMPDNFKVEQYLGQGFGRMRGVRNQRVELRITPPAAGWVGRSRWHASQKLAKEKNGAITLTMTCPVTDSLVRWVLQMADNVKIEKPASLKKMVLAKARTLIANNR